MRSKAPLLLMEQMVMLVVFALAAALCLQAFAASDRISVRNENRDRAVQWSQTVAETLHYYGGAPDQALRRTAETLGAAYGEGVLSLELGDGCRLTARETPAETERLSMVRIVSEDESGETLFELETAWQRS